MGDGQSRGTYTTETERLRQGWQAADAEVARLESERDKARATADSWLDSWEERGDFIRKLRAEVERLTEKLDAVGQALAAHGYDCECACACAPEPHDAVDCDPCLACLVGAVLTTDDKEES